MTVTVPERSAGTVAHVVGERSRAQTIRRLVSARTAIALGLFAFALNIAAVVLLAAANQTAPQIVRIMGLLPTVAVGMLVAVRRPGNPLGWLLLGCGVLFSTQAAAVAYSVLDYRLHHGALPLGRVAVALQPAWAGGLVLTAGALWLYPDGHLPRGRWRPVGGWLYSGAAAFIACLGIGLFQSDNPTGVAAFTGAVLAAGVTALPIALGIGILKFRLYDIDRIISRTLAYAVVTGLLVGVYAGLVLLATEVLGLHGGVAVAAATLAAAALFNPLRKRVQRVVDRRFNRASYDAEATVAAFAGRLRESVDLAAIQNDLAATVESAFEPTHVSVLMLLGDLRH